MNWNYIYQSDDINSNLSLLYSNILSVINDFVPTITGNHHFNNFPTWFSYELKCLIKEKNIIHLAFKK